MTVRNKIILTLVLVMMVAQLCTPLSMVYRYGSILEQGKTYRFVVEPVDPADPFKGRYVRLTFPIAQGKYADLEQTANVESFKFNDTVYLLLGESGSANNQNNKAAYIRGIFKQKPSKGDYLKAKMGYLGDDEYRLNLPFERYYAEESKAPKIESLVWDRSDQSASITAAIRIKDGAGVIEELYVGEVPVLEYLTQ